jgi:hypothetical protein
MLSIKQIKQALDIQAAREQQVHAYLGMSQIGRCPQALAAAMLSARGPQLPGVPRLRVWHEGYLHERDILERLGLGGLPILDCQRELVAPWDARFRGHIDGSLDGVLIEVKSVASPTFQEILRGGLPTYHLYQVQAYLRYGGYPRAWVIYKKREDGDLWINEMRPDPLIGEMVEEKARLILAAVDAGVWPECTCGRCR